MSTPRKFSVCTVKQNACTQLRPNANGTDEVYFQELRAKEKMDNKTPFFTHCVSNEVRESSMLLGYKHLRMAIIVSCCRLAIKQPTKTTPNLWQSDISDWHDRRSGHPHDAAAATAVAAVLLCWHGAWMHGGLHPLSSAAMSKQGKFHCLCEAFTPGNALAVACRANSATNIR